MKQIKRETYLQKLRQVREIPTSFTVMFMTTMLIARTKHEDTQFEGVIVTDIARWLENR